MTLTRRRFLTLGAASIALFTPLAHARKPLLWPSYGTAY